MINENAGEQAALAIIKFIKVLFTWLFKVLLALLIIGVLIIAISEDRFTWNDLYKYKDPYYSYNHKTDSNGYPSREFSLEELDNMMNKPVLTDTEFQRKEFLSTKCKLTVKEMIELKELDDKSLSQKQFSSLKPYNKKCL